MIEFISQVEFTAADGESKPKVNIVGYGGGVMRVPGFGDVAVDLAGLQMPANLPILADHDPAQPIGHGTPRVVAGKLVVEGVVSVPGPLADRFVASSKEGFPWQASLGAHPTSTERVTAGTTVNVNKKTFTAGANGLTVVRAGILKEMSIVSLGADPSTSAIAAKKGEPSMTTTIQTPELQAERERTSAIHSLKGADAHPKIVAEAVSQGWSVDKTRAEILESQLKESELHRVRGGRPQAPSGIIGAMPQNADQISVLKAAAALHLAPSIAEKAYGANACELAAALRVRSLRDLYAAACRMTLGTAPSGDNDLIRAAYSSANVPSILADVASKEALAQYNAAPSAWRQVCRRVPVKDFKTHHMVRLLLSGALEQVAPTGELKHASASDEDFTVAALTYGKIFGISRQDVINDDAGAFMDMSRILGRKGAQIVNKLFAQTLLGNANNFFHADNGNFLTGSDTALSVNALIAALANLRNRKDADGENLDIAGAVLVVPPSLEATGRAILKSVELQRYVSSSRDNAPMGNPVENILTLVVEPRLENSNYTGHSALAWYVFSAPSDGAVVMAFLNGQENPTVEQEDQPFNTLGVQFRAFIDAGCSLADPAAALKVKGEA